MQHESEDLSSIPQSPWWTEKETGRWTDGQTDRLTGNREAKPSFAV